MRIEKGTKLSRYGKRHHHIITLNAPFKLVFYPLLGVMVLAMGAVPVSAGVRQVGGLVTIATLKPHHWAVFTAAVF